MTGAAGMSDLVAAVRTRLGQTHSGQPREAGTILQPIRPSGIAAQGQPVQGRAAAGFEIRFVPHRPGENPPLLRKPQVFPSAAASGRKRGI